MEREEFVVFRKKLDKTQKQIASLLGTSINAVHSYEQGWRSIPAHVERQIIFLVFKKSMGKEKTKPCWRVKKCPPGLKKKCPAWEFNSGDICWFINGTVCGGVVHKNWKEKIKDCRSCEILTPILERGRN